MTRRFFELVAWLVELFAPPPLASMTRLQKVGRVLLVTVTLVVCSILAAMLGAVAIFLFERGRRMVNSFPEMEDGLGIILVAIGVNAACVFVLLQIRRADGKLMPGQR